MPIINLQTKAENFSYQIQIQENLLENLTKVFNFKDYSKIVILTDEVVASFWLKKIETNLTKNGFKPESVIIPNGEKNKNLEIINQIYTKLLEFEIDRKGLLICLGGGVIGDLGGFVAATWLRGIDFLQIPTTLLAQVDSSVGGKTGFDFLNKKNLIGAFKQPVGVLIDTSFLQTLPNREYKQGLAEVLKYGLIWDSKFWVWLKENRQILLNKKATNFNQIIIQAIQTSCQIKAQVVEKDELETAGIRQLLNFGHTFGHSLESYSLKTEKPLFHGEAIAVGMNFASEISNLTEAEKQDIKETLELFNLPVDYNIAKKEQVKVAKELYQNLFADKKNYSGKISWVLLQKIGKAIANQHLSEKIVINEIQKTIKS
jgi:3-dehydroquinate synthase